MKKLKSKCEAEFRVSTNYRIAIRLTANQLRQVIESVNETINEMDAFDEPDEGLTLLEGYLKHIEQTEVTSH